MLSIDSLFESSKMLVDYLTKSRGYNLFLIDYIDTQDIVNLRKAINENYANTTSIIVTQRISSIMFCDHILVIEEGDTIGYGTHEELMKSCDVYKEIYISQMGGDINE